MRSHQSLISEQISPDIMWGDGLEWEEQSLGLNSKMRTRAMFSVSSGTSPAADSFGVLRRGSKVSLVNSLQILPGLGTCLPARPLWSLSQGGCTDPASHINLVPTVNRSSSFSSLCPSLQVRPFSEAPAEFLLGIFV